MSPEDARERRVAWMMLILCPLSVMLLFCAATMGYGRALALDRHPIEYLQVSFVLWAVIMTVLPIMRLVRLISLPRWFLIMIYADMYMFVIWLFEGFYFDIFVLGPIQFGWGDFTHVVSGMIVAAIVFVALCLIESRSPKHVTFGTKGTIVLLVFLSGCAFGAFWEIMEGFTDIIAGHDYMVYRGVDTLYDLLADLIGGAVMALIAWVMLRRHSAKEIASKVRMGKKNIDNDHLIKL